ncbi:MAG: hypothetical protein Q4G33_06795 [bacterium]|nr:hypothetical protein [bacterium]
MSKRLELHEILCGILGSRNVYFQPPESVKMNYPAVVYSRNNIDTLHGDNLAYVQTCAYLITLIDKNPDSKFVEKIAQLPLCRHQRNYQADNLNHDVFLLYF